ncbi:hypothetical protein V495_08180 [Pseudogymnoascus sp. VKM F-4514 (FW-929)]|nr:hypothetical protein V495_08180 [Pseudogymnoascus sp. VKM F-4514 (FW-929)]
MNGYSLLQATPRNQRNQRIWRNLKDIPDRAGKKDRNYWSDFQITPKSPSNGPAAKLAKVPRVRGCAIAIASLPALVLC